MQNADNSGFDPFFKLMDFLINEIETTVIPKLPRAKIIIYETKPREITDNQKIYCEIHEIGRKEVPFLDADKFSSHAIKLPSYQLLFILLKIISEYPDWKIKQVLFNIYSHYYRIKFIQNITSTDAIKRLHTFVIFYYIAELLAPYVSKSEKLLGFLPTKDKWEKTLRVVAQKYYEKVKRLGIKIDSYEPIDLANWEEFLNKSTANIKIPLRVKDFLQGIHLENDEKVYLGDNLYLRAIRAGDFSDRFYEIVDIIDEKEIPKHIKVSGRLTSILNGWELIRSKWMYMPSSVLEMEGAFTFPDLTKGIMRMRMVPYALNLYDIIFSRPIHEEIFLYLENNNYIRLPLFEFLNYVMGVEEKRIYPFPKYQMIKPIKAYTLKKAEKSNFQAFVKKTMDILSDFLFKLLWPIRDIKEIHKISIIRVLNAIFQKNDALIDEIGLLDTIVPLIASFEYLFSKPREHTSSRDLSKRMAKLLNLVGLSVHGGIIDVSRKIYNMRSNYLHGKLLEMKYSAIKGENQLPRIDVFIKYLNMSSIIFLLTINKGDTQNWLIDQIDKSMLNSEIEIKLRKYIQELIKKHDLRKQLSHYFVKNP